MSDGIKNKINEAICNFYLEADKDIIKESLKGEILNHVEYKKKKRQIIDSIFWRNKKGNNHEVEIKKN